MRLHRRPLLAREEGWRHFRAALTSSWYGDQAHQSHGLIRVRFSGDDYGQKYYLTKLAQENDGVFSRDSYEG